ncbi:MAG: S8 family peptidase [Thermoleophilaceae bacterium]
MTRRITFAVLAATVALAVLAAAIPAGGAAATGSGRYIVVLKGGTSDPGAVANDHGRRYGARVSNVYGHALKGYSATIPESKVDDLRRNSSVAYVERDSTVTTTAQTLPWGVDKVDADTSSTQAGNGSGTVSGVNAYVIDTGIASHQDLNLTRHVNFAGGKNTDCNGHGTHVAGTVAARDNTVDVVGVAPGAPLTGVKVLGCNGSGSTSGVIKGIDWVTANAARPAVANMSLGGSASQALDDAVRRSASSGVTYAIAAGNDGANACTQSPARAGTTAGVITVAATDSSDSETSWSNYGSCVDIWAPGLSILSTRRGGGTTTMSGTSMATPHVTGGSALYLSGHSGTPADVESALKAAATTTSRQSKDGRTITRLNVAGF